MTSIAALTTLREIGPDAIEAVPALIQALESESEDHRGDVVFTLRDIGYHVLPALLKALAHENPNVRYSAAEAIGSINFRKEIPSEELAKIRA